MLKWNEAHQFSVLSIFRTTFRLKDEAIPQAAT